MGLPIDALGILNSQQNSVPNSPDQDPSVIGASLSGGNASPPTQGPKGGLKHALASFLTGMMQGAGQPYRAQEAEIQQRQAQTGLADTQTDLARQNAELVPMTDANGQPQINPYTGQPVMVTRAVQGQLAKVMQTEAGKNQRAQASLAQKAWATKINDQLKGLGLGVNVGFDAQDNPTITSIPKANLPAPVAAKTNKTPNEIGLIIAAQNGDTEAQKTLNTLYGEREKLMEVRGASLGKARLYQLQKVIDPETGSGRFATGFEILQRQQAGMPPLIPAGALSAKDVVSVQQLQSEAMPAINAVRQDIGAFDNADDRAIFARVLRETGGAQYGNEASWMKNVIDQALKSGLSEQGKREAQNLARLAETMGRLRSTLGLPATDQSMAVTLSLLPSASTPNSAYAKRQTDMIEQMVGQAVSVPMYKGVSGGGKTAPKQQGGGKNDPLGIR